MTLSKVLDRSEPGKIAIGCGKSKGPEFSAADIARNRRETDELLEQIALIIDQREQAAD